MAGVLARRSHYTPLRMEHPNGSGVRAPVAQWAKCWHVERVVWIQIQRDCNILQS